MKPPKPDVFMPCMVKDLLADTLHLDNAQFGSYWLLICAYWMRRGPLQNNDTQLRTIARCSEQAWPNTKSVLEVFFQVTESEWKHRKIDSLLSDAVERMKSNRDRSSKAAAARWGEDVDSEDDESGVGEDATSNASCNAQGDAQALLNGLAKHCSTDVHAHAHSHSPLKGKSTRKKVGANESRPTQCDDAFLAELSNSPAYAGIDVRVQFEKMVWWCKEHRKTPSRKRLINWLNRTERPMATSPTSPSSTKSAWANIPDGPTLQEIDDYENERMRRAGIKI